MMTARGPIGNSGSVAARAMWSGGQTRCDHHTRDREGEKNALPPQRAFGEPGLGVSHGGSGFVRARTVYLWHGRSHRAQVHQ